MGSIRSVWEVFGACLSFGTTVCIMNSRERRRDCRDTTVSSEVDAFAMITRINSAEELAKLPSDGCRYELVEGVLKMMSPAGGRHGRITVRVNKLLAIYVDDHQLGVTFAAETGFLLGRNPDTVRAPDAAFVRQERMLSRDGPLKCPSFFRLSAGEGEIDLPHAKAQSHSHALVRRGAMVATHSLTKNGRYPRRLEAPSRSGVAGRRFRFLSLFPESIQLGVRSDV